MTSTCFKIRTVCYHQHDHFCNQLFLALTDSVSVKVVLYKRCKFCPVFFALSTTEEASNSWGETFGDQKRHRLVCGKLLEKDDLARITQKLHCILFPETAVPHRTGILQHRTNMVNIKNIKY